MADPIEWPRSLRRVASTFHPLTLTRSGGRTITGAEQIVSSDAGYWTASIAVLIRNTAELHLWRAIQAQILGRTSTIYVGPENQIRQPAAAGAGYVIPSGAVTHSDGSYFSDGSSYESGLSVGSLSGAVAVGGISGTIVMPAGQVLLVGQFFEVAKRLYVVRSSSLATTDTYAVTFWPRARSAWASGTPILMDNPRGTFRLSADTDATMDEGLGIPLSFKANFVEASP